MTNETEPGRRWIFVPAVLPWLLGGGMFAVYWLTLFHAATSESIGRLADVSGWDWRPKLFAPLTFLATYPIRWLPDYLKLPGLNLFAAGCAALAMVLLARSIALLPHDRTNEQRVRQADGSSRLSIPTAWLPPLFAVLVCGLQMSFWERSVQFVDDGFYDNAEIFNLVLFAYVVRCLLEFRASGRESWLARSALVFGLGVANNWAMVAFFPIYLIALVWLQGFDFFQWRFLVKMLVLGTAGFCLILLPPLLISQLHFKDFGFGHALQYMLSFYKNSLIHPPFDRKWFLVLSVTSVLPVLLIAIRWTTSFGDNSPLGAFLASSAMTVAYGFFMICCLWVAMDPQFGPRQLVATLTIRMPFLPLFYLGALSAGYFLGYFLLVFGSRPLKQRQRTPALQQWFNRAVVTIAVLVAMVVPGALALNNYPRIRAAQQMAAVGDNYFSKIEQALPSRDSVVLSDSAAMLFRLEAFQARQKIVRKDIFIDTSAVAQYWAYLSYLEANHPQDAIGTVFTDRTAASPEEVDCIHLLENLSNRHDLFYLQPSFGYYFERFYMHPRGLVYPLTEYATNSWSPAPLVPGEIAANQSFWRDASNDINSILHALNWQRRATNAWEQFTQTAFFLPETNRAAGELAQLYSRALNYWGVALQRTISPADAAQLREPAECFNLAQQLNPQNGAALVNLDFNRNLRQHTKPDPKAIENIEDRLPGNYLHWYDLAVAGGPFDEPSFCLAFGLELRKGNNYRQAIQQFQRVEALMPGNPGPPMLLAQTFLGLRNHDLPLSYAFPKASAAYFDAVAATDRALLATPGDTNVLYLKTLSLLELGASLQGRSNEVDRPYPSAKAAFENSLATSDQLLQRDGDDAKILFFKTTALEQLGRFDEAIPLLSHLISTKTNDSTYYFSRAIAYFQSHNFEAAKGDYEFLVQNNPRMYTAYFGLGEIAYTNKDYPEALKNYELYLTNAPDYWRQSTEYQEIEKRVGELKSAPH